jgi:hypothetical protein
VAILDRSDDYDCAVNTLEPYYIAKYQTRNRSRGYNLTNGGEGGHGYQHTDETKALLREIKTGKRLSVGHCKSISEASKKKRHSQETREKMKQSALARWANQKLQQKEFKSGGTI